MMTLYNWALPFLMAGLRIVSLWNPKIRRGIAGRTVQVAQIAEYYRKAEISGPRLLVHVASFGELEQARPVLAALQQEYPTAHVHLTFFSPSGYENTIGTFTGADYITYLPPDTPRAVRGFLDAARPDFVLFVRYDVWPNMAMELQRRGIPAMVVAASAAQESGRMMPIVRGLHARVYNTLQRLVVISEEDRQRFIAMGVLEDKISVGGDTRADQVWQRRAMTEAAPPLLPKPILDRISENSTLVFVAGSTWPADEAVLVPVVQSSIERGDNVLWVLVPHEPEDAHVRKLLASFPAAAVRLSKIEEYAGERVIVVDSIGKLFALYGYADIALVGGGFSEGVHNVLEASVWGIPALIGPNHRKSQEVQRLIDRTAVFETASQKEFEFAFWQLANSEELRESAGRAGQAFIDEERGATDRIRRIVRKYLPQGDHAA